MRNHSIGKALIATVGAAMLSITPAFAQKASSFDQLQLLVKPGDTIVVTDASGHSTKGKIQSLSASALKIADKGTLREFTLKETLEVSQRRSDSLGNGAAAGAAVGAGIAALGVLSGCRESTGCDAKMGAAGIGLFAGMGAGVGVLIDAIITNRQTIYEGPKTTALRRLDMKPILTKDKKGAAVAFSF